MRVVVRGGDVEPAAGEELDRPARHLPLLHARLRVGSLAPPAFTVTLFFRRTPLPPPEMTEAQRTLEEKQRRGLAALDVDAPHVLQWEAMPLPARAAAGAAAVFASLPLETRYMRYDPRTKVAFVVVPDPNVAGRRRCAERAVPATVDLALAPVLAAYGGRAGEIRQFIKRRA